MVEASIKNHASFLDNLSLKHYFREDSPLLNMLSILLKELNWHGEYRQLVESLPHFADELELTDFLNILSSINYDAEKITINLSDIESIHLPSIFVPEDGGLMLVIKSLSGKLMVFDSDENKKKIIEKTNKKGVLIYFSEHEEALGDGDGFFSKIKLTAYKTLGTVLLLSFFVNLFSAVIPLYIMIIYDKIIPSYSSQMLVNFSIGVFFVAVGLYAINLYRTKVVSFFSARLDKIISEEIIKKILYLPPMLTENNSIGNQMARVRELKNIKDFFASPIAITLCELPFVMMYLAIIYWLAGWLALVPVVLVIVFAIIYLTIGRSVHSYNAELSSQNSKIQEFVLETFYNMTEVKKLNLTRILSDKHDFLQTKMASLNFKQSFYESVLSACADFLMMLSALCILMFGTLVAMNEEVSLGALIAIMMLTWKMLNPIKMIFGQMPVIDQVVNSTKQLIRLFNINDESVKNKTNLPLMTTKAKVELERVFFKYNPNASPALLGLNFVIAPGEFVCVTGNNSSGKSTLLRMIAGMYPPQAGQVKVNNMNIQQFNPVEYRHHVSYMPQDQQLFFGTIRQNLMFGNIVASPHEIEIATRVAGIYEDIMELPEGFNTKMGDNASHIFSSSFIQGIMLARTYLHKSAIMIFDEPANHLDEDADKQMIEVFQWLRKESTIIVATHRPSHLKMADKILYMENGQMLLYGEPDFVLERMPNSVFKKRK